MTYSCKASHKAELDKQKNRLTNVHVIGLPVGSTSKPTMERCGGIQGDWSDSLPEGRGNLNIVLPRVIHKFVKDISGLFY